MTYPARALLLILLIPALSQCKKSKPTYDFSYSGDLITDQKITFKSIPDQKGLIWYFGDGTAGISGTSTPTHIFKDAGTFIVTLTANGHSVQKSIIITKDPMYTKLLCIHRQWHHTIHEFAEGLQDTSYNGNDVAFAFNYINPLKVCLSNDTFTYSAATDSTLTFSYDKRTAATVFGNYGSIILNLSTSTVNYYNHKQPAATSFIEDNYESY